MGFWSGLMASRKKSAKLKELSKILGNTNADIYQIVEMSAKKADAKNELFDLVENDPQLAKIMEMFGADRASLNSVFAALTVNGGGWAKGHWVAASSITFGPTLAFVLANTKNGTISDYDTWIEVSYKLFDYFDKNRMGAVT